VLLEDSEDDPPSPAAISFDNHQAFIFGFSSTMVNMRELYPTINESDILWKVFVENVDPVSPELLVISSAASAYHL